MNRTPPRLPGRNAAVEDWELWSEEMLDYTTHLEADAQSLRSVITDVLGVPDSRIEDLEMLAMDLQRRRAEAAVAQGAGETARPPREAPRRPQYGGGQRQR